MLINTFKTINGSVVGIWKIEENEEELLKLASLSQEDKAKFNAFLSKKRRVEFLAVRALLKALSINGQVLYNSQKPFLLSGNISISHSTNMAAVIFNKSMIVGIDIERINERICRVAEKIFSQKELVLASNNVDLLTTLWSCKECAFKIQDEQTLDFKQSIEVDISDLNNIHCKLILPSCEDEFFLKKIIVQDNIMVYGEKNKIS